MKTKRIISRIMILAVTLVLTIPGSAVYAAEANAKISKSKAPSSITQGKDFTVKGKIKTSKKIKKIEIGVTSQGGGKWTAQKYEKKNVNAKSFDVSKANKKLRFDKLKVGTYYYRIYVHTSDKKVATVVNKKFTVKANAEKPVAQDCNAPSTLPLGLAYSIGGTISSSKKMSKVTVGVVNKNGKWTSQKKVLYPLKKTFKVKSVDKDIKFGNLAKGAYAYKITAKVGNKTYTVVNKPFVVVAPEPIESDGDTQIAGDSVVLKNYNLPEKKNVGTKQTMIGTINSDEVISRVEIGIVFEPTNKWTSCKYDKKAVNAKTFDIGKAADKLEFDRLPGGTYRYRIYVHTASGAKLVLNHKFEIVPSDKPMNAVNWAVEIANDDSFTYGEKPKANANGCYFCGTNCGPVKHNKPKGYEKTYVCLTFIGAAYAHGAQAPEILAECKRGRITIYENDTNFSRFTCWMKLGSCKELRVSDLQPGDVIIKWSDHNDNNGHVCMYIGGDQFVESSGGGWGANSIAVKSGMAKRLSSYSSNSKNYVMRYRN